MNSHKVTRLAEVASACAVYATKIKGAKIGAVAVCGKSTYKGVNSRVSHPLQAAANVNPYMIGKHAELDALLRADKDIDSMVVVRIRSNGSWGCAKPCVPCQSRLAGVEVWYSTGNGKELQRLNT